LKRQQICASWPSDVKKAIEVGQRFSLETAFIIPEKGFYNSAKTD